MQRCAQPFSAGNFRELSLPDDLKWLQKTQLVELGSNFRTVWTIYIAFYMAFHTISIASMGWFLTSSSLPLLERETSGSEQARKSIIPTTLAIWGAGANATAMAGVILAWWYVSFRMH